MSRIPTGARFSHTRDMSATRSYCVCIFQTRACEHTGSGNLFASAQCLGYRQEHGDLTQEICLPPDHIVFVFFRLVPVNILVVVICLRRPSV